MPAAAHTAPVRTVPSDAGFPRRPARASRRASYASLHQPTESWPVSTAAVTSAAWAPSSPAPTARAQASAVTASAGPGWHARASPTSGPRRTAPAGPATLTRGADSGAVGPVVPTLSVASIGRS